MKTNILQVIIRTYGMMMSTSQTWEETVNDTDKKPFRNYFLILLLFCAAIVLAFKTIYADSKPVESGIIYAVITLIAFTGTYYLARYFCSSYLKKNHPDKNQPLVVEKIVAYSFSVVFPIKIITTIIPSLFFLQILNVYTIYIVWEGCRIVFDMDEDERGKIMLIIGLSVMFLPAIISKIILFLIPGF